MPITPGGVVGIGRARDDGWSARPLRYRASPGRRWAGGPTLSGGSEPLFPFLRGSWFVAGMEQKVSPFRAVTVLGMKQPQLQRFMFSANSCTHTHREQVDPG